MSITAHTGKVVNNNGKIDYPAAEKRSAEDTREGLVSQPFRMGNFHFARVLLARWGRGWLIGMGVISLAAVVAGIVFDWRWFMVGMMFLLVILPGVLALVYYSAALRKGCYLNLPEHSLQLVDGGVKVRLSEREIFFPLTGREPRSVRGNGTLFSISPSRKGWRGFIWVPVDAFPTEKEYVEFTRGMRRGGAGGEEKTLSPGDAGEER